MGLPTKESNSCGRHSSTLSWIWIQQQQLDTQQNNQMLHKIDLWETVAKRLTRSIRNTSNDETGTAGYSATTGYAGYTAGLQDTQPINRIRGWTTGYTATTRYSKIHDWTTGYTADQQDMWLDYRIHNHTGYSRIHGHTTAAAPYSSTEEEER